MPECKEVLHHECCQEPILTKGEQILLVLRVEVRLRALLDDATGNNDWLSLVGGTNAIERETTGQTCDGAEKLSKAIDK